MAHTMERFIGRYAILQSCSDKSVNGSHVQITSFDPQENKFDINVIDTQLTFSAKFAHLKFISPHDFIDKFPDAPIVQGRMAMTHFPVGSIVDFSSVNNAPLDQPAAGSTMKIKHSCRVIGNRHEPSCFASHVRVDVDDDDIVEFENMCFEQHANPKALFVCVRGDIVFRSCVFRGGTQGVSIARAGHGVAHVVFENCIFRNNNSCGVWLDGGHATFVNCAFSDGGMGIAVHGPTCIDAFYCSFTNCIGGVVVPYQSEATLRSCSFKQMTDFGVLASNSSTITLDKCNVDVCMGDGVAIEGGGGTTAILTNCRFNMCTSGVRVGNGRVVVAIDHITVQSSAVGIYVACDTAGQVNTMDCTFSKCVTDSVNLSGDKCEVVVDGVPESLDQYDRLRATQDRMNTGDVKYGYPISGRGKKILNEVGIIRVVCAQCNETPVTMCKKCAHCRNVRYCSKECQKAHWSRHKMQCQITHARSRELSEVGYVRCQHCGEAEAQNSSAMHCACSSCLKVFYCSKQCQKDDWRSHKEDCKRMSQGRF